MMLGFLRQPNLRKPRFYAAVQPNYEGNCRLG